VTVAPAITPTPADPRAQPPASAGDPRRAILLMLAGVSMFPFMNATVKYLTTIYPLPEVVWARFAGHMILVILIFGPKLGFVRLFQTRHPRLQFGRSALMMSSTLLFVAGLMHVPLATASSIGFTAPLIVTALSVPLLKEEVGWRRWTAVGVGFVGALIIIRPGAGFANWASLLILGNALAYALYQILTRKIGMDDRAETGIAYSALFGTIVMSFVGPFFWTPPQSLLHVVLFLCIGALGGFGHFLIIKAFQLFRPSVLAPMSYVELLGASVLGYLVFGNFPDALTWVGAAVIVASGVYTFHREAVRRRERRRGS
jgi:drug/metabolite transporter (DMT)-like permease